MTIATGTRATTLVMMRNILLTNTIVTAPLARSLSAHLVASGLPLQPVLFAGECRKFSFFLLGAPRSNHPSHNNLHSKSHEIPSLECVRLLLGGSRTHGMGVGVLGLGAPYFIYLLVLVP